MRLLRPGRLAAVSLAVAGLAPAVTGLNSGTGPSSGTTTPSSVITFRAADFLGSKCDSTCSVFSDEDDNVPVGNSTKPFSFTINYKGASVESAHLRDHDDNNNIIGSSVFNGDPSTAGVPMTSYTNGTSSNGVVRLDQTGRVFDEMKSNHTLFFELYWTKDGSQGASYSRTFTFAHLADVNELKSSFSSDAAIYEENRTGTAIPSQTGILSSAPTSATSTATDTTASSATSATSAGDANGNSGSIGSNSSSSSSKGLSSGAIAGIVVGVIVGVLAVVGALLWFFCARRRHQPGAYKSGARGSSAEPFRSLDPISVGAGGAMGVAAADLMAEKEARLDMAAGGIGSEAFGSPNSPYTDEDHANSSANVVGDLAATTPTAAAAGLATTPTPAPTTAPASEPGTRAIDPPTPPISPAPPAQDTAAPAASAAPGTGIHGSVAVLIEEHMTPEDVARLEAEELQLDADIENAMRSRVTK